MTPEPVIRDLFDLSPARQDHDITEAMRTLHDHGVTAADYAEYLAARHSDELRSSGEEPF